MSRDVRRQVFEPSCPSGGKFYACETGSKFVGCCTRQPCSSIGCSDGSLKPASFDPDYYGKFPDQQCPQGSRWYTCAFTDPPFMGCCKSSPCTNGCPTGDLTAGFLDSNPAIAAPFLSSSSVSTKRTTSATSTSSPTRPPPQSSARPSQSSTSTSATSAAQPQSTAVSASSQVSPGAIAGGVVGGVAFVALLILIAVIVVFRRKKRATPSAPELMMTEKPGKGGSENDHGVNRPYEPSSEIHEAPGADVVSKGGKDLSHPGSPYPSPTPAYSPGQPGYFAQSPPGYPAISELDSPGTPYLRHHDSHQSFELSSSDERGPRPRGPIRSGESSDGLRINFAAPSRLSPTLAASEGDQPPMGSEPRSNVSPILRGARWSSRDRGDGI